MKKNNNAAAWKAIQERGISVRSYTASDDIGHDNAAVVELVNAKDEVEAVVDIAHFGNDWRGAHYAGQNLAQTVSEKTGIPLHHSTPARYVAPAPTELDNLSMRQIAKQDKKQAEEMQAQGQLSFVLFAICFVLWAVCALVFGFWIATIVAAGCVYVVRRIG